MHYIKGIVFTRGFQIIALTFDKHLDNYKWLAIYNLKGSVCPFNYRVIINGIKDMLYLNHFNNSFLVVDSTTQ